MTNKKNTTPLERKRARALNDLRCAIRVLREEALAHGYSFQAEGIRQHGEAIEARVALVRGGGR